MNFKFDFSFKRNQPTQHTKSQSYKVDFFLFYNPGTDCFATNSVVYDLFFFFKIYGTIESPIIYTHLNKAYLFSVTQKGMYMAFC
jgi:hypothetical protein